MSITTIQLGHMDIRQNITNYLDDMKTVLVVWGANFLLSLRINNDFQKGA